MKGQHHEWFHRQALFRFRSCSLAVAAVDRVALGLARLIAPTLLFLAPLI
jgi:hypothetical protein